MMSNVYKFDVDMIRDCFDEGNCGLKISINNTKKDLKLFRLYHK